MERGKTSDERKAAYDRLPQWARMRIEQLEANADLANEKLSAGPEDSDTFVDTYGVNPARPLGERPSILFRTRRHVAANGHESDVGYRVRLMDEGDLRVELAGIGGPNDDALHVIPSASNSIVVRAGAWYNRKAHGGV